MFNSLSNYICVVFRARKFSRTPESDVHDEGEG